MEPLKLSLEEDATEESATILRIVEQLYLDKCNFCEGWGHSAYTCTTKKTLDRSFRTLQLGMCWARVKGRILNAANVRRRFTRHRTRMEFTHEARTQLQERHRLINAQQGQQTNTNGGLTTENPPREQALGQRNYQSQ